MKRFLNLVMTWSYWRSRTDNTFVNEEYFINDFDKIPEYARVLAKKWKYKNDRLMGILNYISPPPVAVELETGDCDDFASNVYHVSNKFNPYLFTYFPKSISKAHTITIIVKDNKYHVINWSKYHIFTTLEYLYEYLEVYAKSPIISRHWAQYDYENGKFLSVDTPQL